MQSADFVASSPGFSALKKLRSLGTGYRFHTFPEYRRCDCMFSVQAFPVLCKQFVLGCELVCEYMQMTLGSFCHCDMRSSPVENKNVFEFCDYFWGLIVEQSEVRTHSSLHGVSGVAEVLTSFSQFACVSVELFYNSLCLLVM